MKMNKKSVLSLVLAGSLAFGAGIGSYAWFTSTATSAANTFQAGTLMVDVNDSNSTADNTFSIPLKTANIQPGDILTNGSNGFSTITVKNNGTLPMATFGRFTLDNTGLLAKDVKIQDYKVEFFDENGNPTSRVDEFIKDGVVRKDIQGQIGENILAWVNGSGPLDIMGTPWDVEGLKPHESYKITFKLAYDTDATEQGRTCKLGYEVKTTQVNKDAMVNLKLDKVQDQYITAPGWGMYDYVAHQVGIK